MPAPTWPHRRADPGVERAGHLAHLGRFPGDFDGFGDHLRGRVGHLGAGIIRIGSLDIPFMTISLRFPDCIPRRSIGPLGAVRRGPRGAEIPHDWKSLRKNRLRLPGPLFSVAVRHCPLLAVPVHVRPPANHIGGGFLEASALHSPGQILINLSAK